MSDDKKQSAVKSSKPAGNRRKSRELALKGLYQYLLSPKELRLIIREMADEAEFARADETYFRSLLEGVYSQISELDNRITKFLDRPIVELSPVEHAVLLISAYELIFDVSIPYRVAINEGVELAKSYGGTDGHKYVNGVLDKLAAEARPNEVTR
ncbi:MAG: transcription antitermination factor NusB [Candidatus Methylopumilus sp.]|jgi:N utilization substance protein B|nr:transcription antitermination factor NusB [Candidatus Methylopumilus sp.]